MFNKYIYDLLKTIVIKELKVRYKNTYLGYLWSVANPVLFALTFYFAFKNSLKLSIANYLLYLLLGLFPWQYFSNSITQGTSVFLVNANLIKKVIFPRYMLIAGLVGNHAVHFICTIPVMYGFMLAYGVFPVAIQLIGVPLVFINQSILIIGLTLILGTLNLFFRDMENLTSVLTNVLFYLTPIIYEKKYLPLELQHILMYNPMTLIIEQWRDLLLNNGYINFEMLGISFAYNCVFLVIGIIIYRHFERRFAEVV